MTEFANGKWGLVFLLVLCCLGGVFAQEAPGTARIITPDEAVELAVKNNLTLESERVNLDTKKRKSDLVWNQFLPTLEAAGVLTNDNFADKTTALVPVQLEDYPVYGVMPYDYDSAKWGFKASIAASLNFSFALFKGILTIKRDYQAGILTVEKVRVQTERDVRKAYYSMLLAEEQVGILRESYAAAERQVAMAEANYKAGLSPRLTVLQAQVARDNLKPAIDQAENGLKLAKANFANTLGLPYDTRFSLIPFKEEDIYIPLDVEALISRAAQNKPDIIELKANILTLESTMDAKKLELHTPYLNFLWNYSPSYTLQPLGKEWKNAGTFSITLGMKLNSLFPFTLEGQGIKDLDNQLRSANIGLAQLIRGTELEIYNTVLSLEQARVSAEAQANTVALAEESYKLTEEAYKAGLKDVLEVQNAQLELRKARAGVVEQHFNYLQGLIDLEYSTGVPFGTLSSSKNGTAK